MVRFAALAFIVAFVIALRGVQIQVAHAAQQPHITTITITGGTSAPAAPAAPRLAVNLAGELPRPGNQGDLGDCGLYAASLLAASVAYSVGVTPDPVNLSALFRRRPDWLHNGVEPAAALPVVAEAMGISPAIAVTAVQIGLQDITSTLQAGRPVALDVWDGAALHGAWDGSYVVNVPPVVTATTQEHALVAVGYNAEGLWVENSWSEEWGLGGYALLTWHYVETAGLRFVAATAVTATMVAPHGWRAV